MYQSTSSSSSSQKSMSSAHGPTAASGGGLTRYGSAPGSFLTTAVDSVIGSRQPDSAATLRGPPSFGGHYFSSADSSVVESSRKVVQSSSTSNDLKSSSSTAAAAAAALNRSYGFNDLALGDFSTGRNFNSNGGQSSSSSPLVRQRSSPAGFLGHLSVAEPNGGFSLTMGGGGNGGGRLKSQMSFSGQDNSLSQISEISESFVEAANSCSNGLQSNTNSTHSFAPSSAFTMDSSWDTSNNSIVFAAPHAKRSKHLSDADFFTGLESQFSLPQTTLEMAAVERLLQIPEDSVPCKIRAKRGCATHPRSIAERERRTRISGKLKKLQELVPNMDKQTSYSDMLDLAVQHIKGLQNQIQKLNKEVENCSCGSKECL